jgi:phenylalanyl-tRNA synthetase beta chain
MYGGCDFYTIKGVCENILKLAQIKNYTVVACSDNVSFHPGRCAKIFAGDKAIGVFGEVHPLVLNNYDISTPVYAAELDFDAIFAMMDTNKVYTPLPKYPATTRDFSFVCDEALEVGTIFAEMNKAGGKLVEDISLFDIYRGPQVGENKKSVSIRVTLRAADRTLTVEEAEKVSAKILKALQTHLGIALRA